MFDKPTCLVATCRVCLFLLVFRNGFFNGFVEVIFPFLKHGKIILFLLDALLG